MRLYHGTNTDFSEIDLQKCRPNKDFGRGFYLTDIERQAKDMAVRRCEIERCGAPVVQVYEIDEQILQSEELRVKRFEQVSQEWALFILENRKSKKKVHDFDIVIGPVADDGVVYQLNLYQQSFITLDQLVNELTYKKLNRQFLFSTERAIAKLRRI